MIIIFRYNRSETLVHSSTSNLLVRSTFCQLHELNMPSLLGNRLVPLIKIKWIWQDMNCSSFTSGNRIVTCPLGTMCSFCFSAISWATTEKLYLCRPFAWRTIFFVIINKALIICFFVPIWSKLNRATKSLRHPCSTINITPASRVSRNRMYFNGSALMDSPKREVLFMTNIDQYTRVFLA